MRLRAAMTERELECGYFAQCSEDAGHDGPHHADMYPEWTVPTIEPPAFIGSPSSSLPDPRPEEIAAVEEQVRMLQEGVPNVHVRLGRDSLTATEPPDAMDDAEVLALWADYRHVTKTGNPLGMTFAEYIAARMGPPPVVSSTGTNLILQDR